MQVLVRTTLCVSYNFTQKKSGASVAMLGTFVKLNDEENIDARKTLGVKLYRKSKIRGVRK